MSNDKLLCTFTIDFKNRNVDWSISNSSVPNLINMDDTFIDTLNKINVIISEMIKINYLT